MKTVLAFSGGMDSTVLLWYLMNQGHEVRCLSVDYGQRHRKELVAAKDICLLADVPHQIVDLRGVREIMGGSSQTSDDIQVPEGHYADASMRITVVPNRNMILLALCTAWAVSTKSDSVTYAAHAGDHAVYPDCKPEFANALANAISICDWHRVQLERPFISRSKADICKLGSELGAPLEKTWSCYQGQEFHCGRCGTCTERREAYQLAGVKDSTIYETG